MVQPFLPRGSPLWLDGSPLYHMAHLCSQMELNILSLEFLTVDLHQNPFTDPNTWENYK